MSLAYCAEIVRARDPDRFLSAMAAPKKHRGALFAIYGFNVEVARAPWVSAEPMINEIRLQWWADALVELVDGKPARRHEVLAPLAENVDALSIAALQNLVAARRWDVEGQGFDSTAQLTQYLSATSGGLMWVAARAIGARQQEQAIRDVGYASGLAGWFRAFPDLKARGKNPLPDEGGAAIVALARQGLAVLAAGKKLLPAGAHPATRAGWLADRTLRMVVANPALVAANGLQISEFSRKTSLLWRVVLARP